MKTRLRHVVSGCLFLSIVTIATPRTLDDQGRMVGEYLLALDDAGAYSW